MNIKKKYFRLEEKDIRFLYQEEKCTQFKMASLLNDNDRDETP
jgi:hypothetical protein